MRGISLFSLKNNVIHIFKDLTFFVPVFFAIFLGFFFVINSIFVILFLLLIIAVYIAIVKPSFLLIFYFFYAPFTEYLRYLFPEEISIGGKIFILSGSVKEILFFLIIISFLYRKLMFKIQYRNKNTTYYLILSLLALLLINVFRNDNLSNGFWGFRYYLYAFIFYFIGYYFVQEETTIMKIIKTFLLSSTILIVVAFIQIFHNPDFLVSPELLIGKTRESYIALRITSLLSNPNEFGIYLVMVILFAFCLIIYSGSKFLKNLLILISLAAIFVVFYTLSREAWLALATGLFIMSIIYFKNRKYITIILFIVCIIILLHFVPSYFYERVSTISPSGGITRIIMWKNILSSLSEDLIWGSGTGSIGTFGAYGLNVVTLKATGYSVTDNSYLRILVESGIIGLFLLLALCYSIGKDVLYSLRTECKEIDKTISLSALLLLSSILIISIFSESLFSWLSSYIFWLISGYIGNQVSLSREANNINWNEL